VEAIMCGKFFTELISMFVFDTLQMPSGCRKTCGACTPWLQACGHLCLEGADTFVARAPPGYRPADAFA
jgi:hypothetical protein